jgi:hypothetical protein
MIWMDRNIAITFNRYVSPVSFVEFKTCMCDFIDEFGLIFSLEWLIATESMMKNKYNV